MNYDSMTVLDLKTLCKKRGLRVSGNKAEVIIRLMEYDEGESPAPQQVVYQQQPQVIQVISGNQNGTAATFGTLIILYGVFRVGMAMFFSLWDEQVFFFESVLAWLIGIAYITSGIFVAMGYKNGLFITIGTLIISGILSMVYHNEWSPLSIGLSGEMPIMWSLMCSGVCLTFAILPLAIGGAEFKEGWPGGIQRMINSSGTSSNNAVSNEKVSIDCPNCDKSIRVPAGYSGNARCPACRESFRI